MNYFSEMLRLPVVDAAGEKIGVVNDLGIATGEVFPRVTALAFQGPGKTPFMISWRKYEVCVIAQQDSTWEMRFGGWHAIAHGQIP